MTLEPGGMSRQPGGARKSLGPARVVGDWVWLPVGHVVDGWAGSDTTSS